VSLLFLKILSIFEELDTVDDISKLTIMEVALLLLEEEMSTIVFVMRMIMM